MGGRTVNLSGISSPSANRAQSDPEDPPAASRTRIETKTLFTYSSVIIDVVKYSKHRCSHAIKISRGESFLWSGLCWPVDSAPETQYEVK